ncbi:hypothetical protein BDA99DRAFT_540758 [Phascolomyces articulosus]|uniref:Heterokaryon incompatibility domain-containing protein n=1 Tax=Phascolomyces articulosus TaxID=60185 RepID=A0AAD5JTD6_9FUNG|nr:hypothetical protein BDA99DRAFT_540758 [Phascolomyces articulosus]
MGLSKTKFMPTKLVRIHDMKVVKGSQVKEGYYALSYSWNQSGDSIIDQVTGKSMRVDEGKHKIIFPYEKKIQRRGKKNKMKGKVKYVKFEGTIQQICKQFNIQYIWYDQMCINQNNKDEKKNEKYATCIIFIATLIAQWHLSLILIQEIILL